MPEWVAFALSAVTVIAGISYWGGRLARALEGIERTIDSMAKRQDESDKSVDVLRNRVTRLEALEDAR